MNVERIVGKYHYVLTVYVHHIVVNSVFLCTVAQDNGPPLTIAPITTTKRPPPRTLPTRPPPTPPRRTRPPPVTPDPDGQITPSPTRPRPEPTQRPPLPLRTLPPPVDPSGSYPSSRGSHISR